MFSEKEKEEDPYLCRKTNDFTGTPTKEEKTLFSPGKKKEENLSSRISTVTEGEEGRGGFLLSFHREKKGHDREWIRQKKGKTRKRREGRAKTNLIVQQRGGTFLPLSRKKKKKEIEPGMLRK